MRSKITGRCFSKPFFSHPRKLFSEFPYKIFDTALHDIIGLRNFSLSLCQPSSRITLCYSYWCYTFLWSSISAKTRSLYSVLDLLYFMLPYTMRHPTVLTLWLNFSIVHGTFCFSHSISRNWHTKLTIFCFFDRNGQLRNFRLSMLCYSASFDILPQSIERGHRGRS